MDEVKMVTKHVRIVRHVLDGKTEESENRVTRSIADQVKREYGLNISQVTVGMILRWVKFPLAGPGTRKAVFETEIVVPENYQGDEMRTGRRPLLCDGVTVGFAKIMDDHIMSVDIKEECIDSSKGVGFRLTRTGAYFADEPEIELPTQTGLYVLYHRKGRSEFLYNLRNDSEWYRYDDKLHSLGWTKVSHDYMHETLCRLNTSLVKV